MDRVTNISWRTTSGATLGGFSYEYDALGRIPSRSPAFGTNAFDRVYSYDDLDRLTSDGDVAYTYDAAGNRMTRTENGETITYTLGVGDRLASWTGSAYTYNAAGNVTRIERDGKPTLDLTWNSQYQLVSVATNGVFAESYTYDALNRRVTTTTLEGTTRHVYDDNWQVVADIDEQGNVVASYTWGEGIDKLLAVTVGGATYYALTDIQGTVWGYVDSQNNIVARWEYDAWGNVLSEEIDSSAALARLRYRFQGREWSAATGLINFRMRWYDAETGRWLSKDPIGLSGGLNLYAFCGNSPSIMSDPLGQISFDEVCAWMNGFAEGFADAVNGGELQKGLAATVDGLIPFGDPFEDVYSGKCGTHDGVYDVSKMFGTISFECFTTAVGIKASRFLNAGKEIQFGKNLRIAPNGNRTGNALGELPHYHRRGMDANGMTRPGQGIGRHRPWETKSSDTSFWDRF